jgi:hypothetical protein
MRKVQVVGDPPRPFETYVKHISSDLGMQILGAQDADSGYQLLKTSQDGNYITLEVSLGADWKPAAAKEFLDGVIQRVQAEMQQDYDERRGRQLNLRAEQVQRLREDRDQAARRLEDYRGELRKKTGRLDITPKNLRDAMSKLQDENQQLELDLRGKEARAAALAKAIADLTKESEATNKGDDVLAELQQVVESREKQLELLNKNFAAGLNTSAEVQQVAAQTAEARAKVAERKRDAIASAGGEALSALNRELRMLAIDRAEQEARYKLVSDQLDRIGNVSELIDKYDQALASYPKIADRDQEAQASFTQTEMQLNQSVKPSLKVTYSRDWTEKELRIPESDAKDGAHSATKQ